MSRVTVRAKRARTSPLVAAAGLEEPQATTPGHTLIVQGWVIGAVRIPTALRIQYGGYTLREGPLNQPRPDMADPMACGFRTGVALLGLPEELTLSIRVAFDDDEYVELWEIDLSRQPIAAGDGGMQPLLVTTLGRTGSTLMMSVLEAHPEVAVHPVWAGRPAEPAEPRLLMYWLDVLAALAAPTRYLKSLMPEQPGRPGWSLEDSETILPYPLLDEGIERVLYGDQAELVADLARRQVRRFYQEIARLTSKPEPLFFAEKFLPGPIPMRTAVELFPRARQLILVRDFRDMVASILAYNTERRHDGFDRTAGQTVEEYVVHLGGAVELLAAAARHPAMPSTVVRYEDLVRTPELVLSTLLEEVGLSSDGGILSRMVDAVMSRSSASDAHRTVSDAEASIGRWQRDLPPDVQKACDEAFAGPLATFDYT